jgi:transposase-like protein
MLTEDKDVADVSRDLQISEQTYYRWRNQFGEMNANDTKTAQGAGAAERQSSIGCWPTRSWRRPHSGRLPGKLLTPE